jgi:glycosyltransferase involved in cell wall biosynthesis
MTPELIRLAEQTYHLPLNKIVNSMWLAKQMEERYGEKPPIVNPAIDHTVFYPRKRQKLTSELRVLCFAKQARWKGFPEALVAMKLIARKKKNVKFIAFGLEEPSYKAEVPYEFIKAPSDDQLAALYTSADVVMCPSWYESFPLYPLEAMACGAPIVTTPFGTRTMHATKGIAWLFLLKIHKDWLKQSYDYWMTRVYERLLVLKEERLRKRSHGKEVPIL